MFRSIAWLSQDHAIVSDTLAVYQTLTVNGDTTIGATDNTYLVTNHNLILRCRNGVVMAEVGVDQGSNLSMNNTIF